MITSSKYGYGLVLKGDLRIKPRKKKAAEPDEEVVIPQPSEVEQMLQRFGDEHRRKRFGILDFLTVANDWGIITQYYGDRVTGCCFYPDTDAPLPVAEDGRQVWDRKHLPDDKHFLLCFRLRRSLDSNPSKEESIEIFKRYLSRYLPEDFDYMAHMGKFSAYLYE